MIIVPPPAPIPGVDYAWAHPDPAGLYTAGMRFACRYLSPDPSKNLTLTEAQQLAAHGIACVANFESTATEAENGHDAGVADATMALTQASAAGMPAGRPIYFSVDENTTVGPHIQDYFTGLSSVLPLIQIGAYGDYTVISELLNEHLISWAWETTAWSGIPTVWDPRVHIRQVQNGITIGGASVDLNQAMTTDFGQWTPGDDSMSQADIDAINAHTDSQIQGLLQMIGARFDAVDKADKAISGGVTVLYGRQTKDANGNIIPVDPTHTGIGDVARALGLLPDKLSAAVVAHLPATSGGIDAAALEAAIKQIVRDELAGVTATTTITPGATP